MKPSAGPVRICQSFCGNGWNLLNYQPELLGFVKLSAMGLGKLSVGTAGIGQSFCLRECGICHTFCRSWWIGCTLSKSSGDWSNFLQKEAGLVLSGSAW